MVRQLCLCIQHSDFTVYCKLSNTRTCVCIQYIVTVVLVFIFCIQ